MRFISCSAISRTTTRAAKRPARDPAAPSSGNDTDRRRMDGDGSRACPIVVRDPDDGSVVGEVQPSSARALEAALDAGAGAARRIQLPTYERVRILETCAARVAAEQEAFAQLIATEGVKT